VLVLEHHLDQPAGCWLRRGLRELHDLSGVQTHAPVAHPLPGPHGEGPPADTD
jgi:hypothetical protein